MIMDFLLILFFLSLKAFFVLGEYSLSRFSSYSEQDIANKNSLLFKIAYKISENFDKYEQTIKLGLIFSIFGFMGVSYHFFFNNHFSVWAQILGAISIELNNPNVQLLTIILFFLLNLIFVFVLGSVFPTSIAKHNITKSGLLSAPVVLVSHFLFYPITMFSDFINNFFERFFGFGLDTEENNQNIHDELKYLIEESSKLSEMDDEGRDLIENVFEFSNTTVKKIMTKRNDISALDIDDELNVIITKIINDGYSRYPVYKDSLDNIIGIVNVKDLFNSYINTPELPILEILRNAVYIIEDELIDNLLKIMKTQKVHLVIVRDEFGGTSGIITMEDI